MPLILQAIEVGVIAYFDDQLLIADRFIDCGSLEIDRPGPFVCVQIEDDRSVWCSITTQYKRERLYIDEAWRAGGAHDWLAKPQYLNDGLATFFGPSASFVACGVYERPFLPPIYRPRILPGGITAILAEIEKQGGPLL